MIEFLKTNIREVNLFIFVINGKAPRLDEALRSSLAVYETQLSKEIWKSFSVCYTNWSQADREKTIRERQNYSELTRKNEVTNWLNHHFPETRNFQIPVFFHDCWDINEPFDSTTDTLKNMYELAKNNPRFDCMDLVHIPC